MIRSLEFRNGAFNCIFGQQLLNGLVTPSIPGSAPAAGLYRIWPPLEDVVFGLVAIMTPVGVWGTAKGGGKELNPLGGKFLPLDDWTQLKNTSQIKFWDKTVPMAGKFLNQGTREEFLKYTSPGAGSASAGPFVLSRFSIPGRNCLIIQSRFTDLMDALANDGGAEVRVY